MRRLTKLTAINFPRVFVGRAILQIYLDLIDVIVATLRPISYHAKVNQTENHERNWGHV